MEQIFVKKDAATRELIIELLNLVRKAKGMELLATDETKVQSEEEQSKENQ